MSYTSPTPQWSPIIDRDLDWKPYNQYPLSKTDQDGVLDLIIGATTDWMSSYLDRPIAPTTFHERFDGWSGRGGTTIMLPYYPVLQIHSMTEFWGLDGPHEIVEQTPAEQYGVGFTAANPPGGTYALNPRTGELTRTFPGLVERPFFPGHRNVEVTWTAGFDPIPNQIKLAALELANHWYRNTQEQETIAGGIGRGGGERDALWPAVPNRVTMLLEPYKQQGVG
jgi:hypothetical protein